MKLKVLLILVLLLLVVAGLFVGLPPSGRLYQDQNSYSLIWKEQWLGLTLEKEVILKTEYWDEERADLSPGYSQFFQEIKVTPSQSFWVKKGAMCFEIKIDRIEKETVLFSVIKDGSSRSFESIDGGLVFEDFDIGVSIRKAGKGELFIIAPGVFKSDDDIVLFSFPTQPRSYDVCRDGEFVRYPWETSKKWKALKSAFDKS